MNNFQFQNPEALLGIPFLVAVFFILRSKRFHANEILAKFAHPASLALLLPARKSSASWLKSLFFWLSLCLAMIALARPQGNPELIERESASLDIFILLDISRSMDAEDLAPSRLKKAKREIQQLTDRLEGDRLGIIAFAGTPVLLVPLTTDYDLVRDTVSGIDTTFISNQGTDIAKALRTAAAAFKRSAETKGSKETVDRSNVVIIMSDGEDNVNASEINAAKEVTDLGGIVYSIAFGTEKGVPIPTRNEYGELAGYKRDRTGNPVVTKVETKSLEEVAKAGGGRFYFSTSDMGEIDDIVRRTTKLQRSSAKMAKSLVYQEYFSYFLLPALILFLFWWILQVQGKLQIPAYPKIRGFSILKAVALFFLLGAGRAEAFCLFKSSDRAHCDQAFQFLEEENLEKAQSELKTLLAMNPDSPLLIYDLAYVLAVSKQMGDARALFEKLKESSSPLNWMSEFNTAGTYALEQNSDQARVGYARLVYRLERKDDKTSKEAEILVEAKRALQKLDSGEEKKQNQDSKQDQKKSEDQKSDSKQDPKKGNSGSPDNKKGEGKDGNDQKKDEQDSKKPDDQKKQGDQKKQSDQKNPDDQKKDDQSKAPQNGDEQKKEPEKEGDQQKKSAPTSKRGRQPFKERDNMSESEAKQILEALKEREKNLKKRLLKKMMKEDKVDGDVQDKDW